VNYFDVLRPPAPFDPSAPAYKDWLHLNILDHSTGAVGLINVSLHGTPYDERSRAVGTGLMHMPGIGWAGSLEIRQLAEAEIGALSIGLERVAVSVDASSGCVLGSVQDSGNRLSVRVRGTPGTAPIIVEEQLPFGSGWISWYAMPRLELSGTWMLGDLQRDLASASGYQDHNWGRWHWGDDSGWEWGAFLAPGAGPVFVLSRATDRDHRNCGCPSLSVRAGDQRRTFTGPSTVVEYSGELDVTLRRLPGAMAALHQDRSRPSLPNQVRVRANDGFDEVKLEFTAHAAAQLIAADPAKRGYGFIHEMPGRFVASGRIGRTDVAAEGLGIFEYVA
jgi:hypothetical protein